jgi:hypothetical protein
MTSVLAVSSFSAVNISVLAFGLLSYSGQWRLFYRDDAIRLAGGEYW